METRITVFGVGRISERVGDWTTFHFEKIVAFFCIRQKNMKQLAFFMNPSRLSWENDLTIVRPDLQCESPHFHGL